MIPPNKEWDLTISFLTRGAPYVLQAFSGFLRKGHDMTMD